ncbi:MAG: DUF4190 domain-containing protein [Gilliamella sp.]|uniref:DUF4190 domain-containing protein n=1 Tax=Gilliamella sp. TaxID=1891236 RepID=UPI00260C2F6A|nr:DUF4190 domain-containing protein [Gilliamella sp.]MCO6552043.1 DUF4190 domain-containing protein [Gilliamella sp.]
MEQQKKATSYLSISSMVCGIISIILPMAGFNIVVGIIAIVLGVIGKNDVINNQKDGLGFAKAGIICGIIGITIWLLFLIIVGGTLLSFIH